MTKGTIICQEEITHIIIYSPNLGAPKNIKQVLTGLKGETEKITIIVWDLNTPMTATDRSSNRISTRK